MRGHYGWFPKSKDEEERYQNRIRQISNGYPNEAVDPNVHKHQTPCKVCWDLNPRNPPTAGHHPFMYSQLQASSKSGCRFCFLLSKALQHYIRHEKADYFEHEIFLDLLIKPGEPILLGQRSFGVRFPSIMLYGPPGMMNLFQV
jgi:hypothetical protein